MTIDYRALVSGLLQAAGISPSEEEVAALVVEQPARIAAINALYAVPEARYEEMEVIPARDLDLEPRG